MPEFESARPPSPTRAAGQGDNLDQPNMLVKGRRVKKLPPAEVARLYQSGWSSVAIARHFGATPTAVLSRLESLGIPRLTAKEAGALSVSSGRHDKAVRGRVHFNRFKVRGKTTALFARDRKGRRYEILIDSADLDALREHGRRWYVVRRARSGYARTAVDGAMVYLHHFLLGSHGPQSPVDHRNHNGLDNRRDNLRITTPSMNGLNRAGPQKGSRSGIRGVNWCSQKNKWQAKVSILGKQYHLGFFDDKHEAGDVVREKLSAIIGEASHA